MANCEAINLSTFHMLTNTNLPSDYVAVGSAADGSTTTIDLSAAVPVGTKGVMVTVMTVNYGGATEQCIFVPTSNAESPLSNPWQKCPCLWNQEDDGSRYQSNTMIIGLSAARTFKFYTYENFTGSMAYYITLGGYYI